MPYPMTQWGQRQRPTVVPRQPDILEQLAPALVNVFGQAGLQELNQRWQQGEAEKLFGQQKELKEMELAADVQKATLAEDRKERGEYRKALFAGDLQPGTLGQGKAGAPPPGEVINLANLPGGESLKVTPEWKARSKEEKLEVVRAGKGLPSFKESAYQEALTTRPGLTRTEFNKEWTEKERLENRRLTLKGVEQAYGPPRDQFNRYMLLQKDKRDAKLLDWFGSGRGRETKKHDLTDEELASLDQRLMSALGIDQELQFKIRMSMAQGATAKQVAYKLSEQLKVPKKYWVPELGNTQ